MEKSKNISLILNIVALAMIIVALVLSIMNVISRIVAAIMLVIGLICISLYTYMKEKKLQEEKEQNK